MDFFHNIIPFINLALILLTLTLVLRHTKHHTDEHNNRDQE